jgi:hypothetical protein
MLLDGTANAWYRKAAGTEAASRSANSVQATDDRMTWRIRGVSLGKEIDSGTEIGAGT